MNSPHQAVIINRGDRVKAFFLHWLIIGGPMILALILSAVGAATYNYELVGTGAITYLVASIWALVVAIIDIVLIFTANTNSLGGRIYKIEYVYGPTGQHRSGTLFLKILVEGLFANFSFGITYIVQFATYRDGQHFVDRMFDLVAVERGSVTGGMPQGGPMQQPGLPMQQPGSAMQQPGVGVPGQPGQLPGVQPQQPIAQNRVQSVSMPPAPTPQPTSAAEPPAPPETAATPWSSPAQSGGFGAPADQAVAQPFGSPGGQPPTAFQSSPPQVGQSPAEQPSAQPPAEPAPAFGPPASPPSQLAEPPVPPLPPTGGIVSSSPFAPKGQAPIPPKPVESPAPAAETPQAQLDDHTVLDPEVADPDAVPTLTLDDGTTIVVDGPVALGRNPEHPDAQPVLVVDESMKLSKTHLLVTAKDGQLHVEDLESRNGVQVEQHGERVRISSGKAVALSRGAQVFFGGRSFTV